MTLANLLRRAADLVDDTTERTRQVYAEVARMRARETAEQPEPEPEVAPPAAPTADAPDPIPCLICRAIIDAVGDDPDPSRSRSLRWIGHMPFVDGPSGPLCSIHAAAMGLPRPRELS